MTYIRVLAALFLTSLLFIAGACAPPQSTATLPPADPVTAGQRLFHDTSLSGSGQVACATCHPRGGHTNNHTYVGLEIVPDGQSDGRSTPQLYGAKDTAPYSWGGGKTLKDNIKGIIVGRMKGAEPTEEQLDQLAAFINSLEFPSNPNLNPDGSPAEGAPAAAARGYKVFFKASCNICHVPPVFAKADAEDIGSGGEFSVPSLRRLSTTAPYFHDGRFPTLRALLPAKLNYLKDMGSTETFSDQEIEDLLVYLNIL